MWNVHTIVCEVQRFATRTLTSFIYRVLAGEQMDQLSRQIVEHVFGQDLTVLTPVPTVEPFSKSSKSPRLVRSNPVTVCARCVARFRLSATQ